jgi:hypothetical protein
MLVLGTASSLSRVTDYVLIKTLSENEFDSYISILDGTTATVYSALSWQIFTFQSTNLDLSLSTRYRYSPIFPFSPGITTVNDVVNFCNTNIPNMIATTDSTTFVTFQWTIQIPCGTTAVMVHGGVDEEEGLPIGNGFFQQSLNINCGSLPRWSSGDKALKVLLKTPKSIPGLTLWFDAADSSTINDGTTIHGTNVSTFIDKVSGVIMRNNNGVSGPTYSWGTVNGKNAIHMPYYSGTDTALKALTASNLSMLDGLTYSMYCVYKPMTTIQDDTLGNQKYVVTIYSDTRINQLNGPGGYANRAIYTGDEGGLANVTRRLNPSGRYIEGNSTTNAPYNDYVTFGEHVPSRHLIAPSSLGKTCITAVRVQPYLKKLGFGFDGHDFYEDISAPRLTEYSSRGIRLDRDSLPVGTNATLIFGSPWWRTANKVNRLYPLEGYFCEFLYFNRFLTDSEANSVRQYLNKKWIK